MKLILIMVQLSANIRGTCLTYSPGSSSEVSGTEKSDAAEASPPNKDMAADIQVTKGIVFLSSIV